jgi:short-subunit dehydrogenase
MKKAAIVTGAGTGPGSKLGTAAALKLSQQGYFVYLVGRNTKEHKEDLQEVALRCRQGASIIGCDLIDPVQTQIKFAADVLGVKIHRIEVLVNNCDRDELLETQNLASVLIPYFKKQAAGRIVNLASDPAEKPALADWTQKLNRELSNFKVRAVVQSSAEESFESPQA